MARLYKCDRCGKLIEDRIFLRKPRKYWMGLRVKKTLCSDCAKSYDEWWDAGMRGGKRNG